VSLAGGQRGGVDRTLACSLPSRCTMSRFLATVDALYFRNHSIIVQVRRESCANSFRWDESMGVGISILVDHDGTAEMVARSTTALETADTGDIQVMDNLDARAFHGGHVPHLHLTYGAGDVPDNAQALVNSLETEKRI